MLRGYRLFVLAIGLILAGASPPHSEKVDQQSATQVQPTPAPSPDNSPYPGYNPDPCYQAKNYDAADLCAQWRAAIAAEKASETARWGNIIAGIGSVLSFLSVVLVIFALKQTDSALGIALRAERAYLYLVPKIGQRHERVVIKVDNKGFGPANVLGCFVQGYVEMPVAKIELSEKNHFADCMDMIVAPMGETTEIGTYPAKEPIFRVEVLYMDTFGNKYRTIGFYQKAGRWWLLKSNTGWLHMT